MLSFQSCYRFSARQFHHVKCVQELYTSILVIKQIKMSVYTFKLLDGSNFEVPRAELSTVGDARALAGRRLGIEEIGRVRLISSGSVLADDTASLEALGVQAIHVVSRPEGVAPSSEQGAPEPEGVQSPTPEQLAEIQAERVLAQSLHAQRQANILMAQQAQMLSGGGDRIVTNPIFAPALEQNMAKMRVLDQRVRGARAASQMTPLDNLSDAQARPTHALSETVFDFSQLLDGFQLPLTQFSNRMKEESYLNTSTTGERINRTADSQALVSNLKELADITTNLALCLESVGVQSRSQPIVGGMGLAGMPAPLPGSSVPVPLPGVPGTPAGMPLQPQPVSVQRRQQQELHTAQHAANIARAQQAQLAQAQVQAAQAAQAQARRRAQADTGTGQAPSLGGQLHGPAPPPP